METLGVLAISRSQKENRVRIRVRARLSGNLMQGTDVSRVPQTQLQWTASIIGNVQWFAPVLKRPPSGLVPLHGV